MSLNFNLGSPLLINFYTGNIDPSISKTKLKALLCTAENHSNMTK